MIDAITRIGALTLAEGMPAGLDRYVGLDAGERESLGALVEPPDVEKTIVLVFDRDPPRFRRHHLEDCMNEDPLRYLYRDGPPNGSLALPYGKVTEALSDKDRAAGKLVKTVKNRLVGWANALRDDGQQYAGTLGASGISWLQALATEIDAKQRELSAAVEERQREVPRKTRLFLTLAFADSDQELPLGHPDLPFAQLFLARNRARMFDGDERIATCSLCGGTAAVSPKFGSDVFPFATFDQPAYVAGGLNRKDAWRAFALCADCYQRADQGRRFTEDHLTRRIGAGGSALSYWVVPSLLNPKNDGDAARDALDLLSRQRDAGRNLTKTERKVLLASEDDLLGDLQDLSDHLAFSLTFVEKAKARERILLIVDDVLPSRLRRLFEAKSTVEKRGHECGYLRDEWEFTLYRHLFPLCEVDRGGGKVDLRRPDFLAILDHVFRGSPLQASYLANTFVGPLRTRFVAWRGEQGDDRDNEFTFKAAAKAAWLTWHFLDDLEIISEEGDLAEMTSSPSDHARLSGPYFEWLEEFFAEGARTFRSDAAKVAFLLGSLADSVREVQLENLKAAPFVKYLKSLRMEQGDLLDLLPRITQKLTEYDEYRGRNRQMLEAVSYYLTRAGIEAWPMTSAELNLIFGMGMNLGYVVRRGPGKTNGAGAADDGGALLATAS